MKTKLIILLILTTMIHTNTVNAQHSQLKRADFQQTIDGKQTDLYFLRNKNGIEIAITNFGGRVVEFWKFSTFSNLSSTFNLRLRRRRVECRVSLLGES